MNALQVLATTRSCANLSIIHACHQAHNQKVVHHVSTKVSMYCRAFLLQWSTYLLLGFMLVFGIEHVAIYIIGIALVNCKLMFSLFLCPLCPLCVTVRLN